MIINIRGTNGSGKTTLARAFQEPGARVVDLAQYSSDREVEEGGKADVGGPGKGVNGFRTHPGVSE